MKTQNTYQARSKYIFIALACIFILIAVGTTVVYAQGGAPPGPPVFPGSPNEAPIDGGLGLLAAAGGSYALKKLRDKKKAEKDLDL
jgi:hypothetical protein